MESTTESSRSLYTFAHKRQWALVAAVAAVPLLAALPARAQFQANNGNGHANDANNQVGSGGYNSPSRVGSSVTTNDIIYNNVTRGQGFRGVLQSTDPLAFRGQTFAGSADGFIADSNPAAVRGTPSATSNYPTVQPFYSETRGVAPPLGYVSVVNGGGYVLAGSYQASQFINQLSDTAQNGAYRTGAAYGQPANMNPTFGINGAYAPYGTTSMLGPLDAANQQTLIVASPLSGIQQAPLNNGVDNYFMSRTGVQNLSGGGRYQRLDPQTIQKMQQELQQQQDEQSPNGQPNEQNPNELNKPMPQALETPINQPLGTAIPSHPLNTQKPLNSGVQTQEGMYRTLTTAAAQQTPVLDELHQRLDRYNGTHAPTDAELESNYQKQVKAAAAKTPGATPGIGLPNTPGHMAAGGPPMPATPGANLTPYPAAPKADTGAAGRGTKTAPMKITSLATGVRASGLAGLLRAAEEMMKQGKYTSAIDQYTLAEQVAPNNPLIPLGQANAELGAASYRDAEVSLRQAFSADPALLHAQFDLNSLVGQQRVKTVSEDLKDLAAKEPTSEMPAFLLAYINYNTGHEADAIGYLKDVEKREGHPDAVVGQMREHWYLPATGATKPALPEMNK